MKKTKTKTKMWREILDCLSPFPSKIDEEKEEEKKPKNNDKKSATVSSPSLLSTKFISISRV